LLLFFFSLEFPFAPLFLSFPDHNTPFKIWKICPILLLPPSYSVVLFVLFQYRVSFSPSVWWARNSFFLFSLAGIALSRGWRLCMPPPPHGPPSSLAGPFFFLSGEFLFFLYDCSALRAFFRGYLYPFAVSFRLGFYFVSLLRFFGLRSYEPTSAWSKSGAPFRFSRKVDLPENPSFIPHFLQIQPFIKEKRRFRLLTQFIPLLLSYVLFFFSHTIVPLLRFIPTEASCSGSSFPTTDTPPPELSYPVILFSLPPL